jgi:hypothetical protein
MTNSITNRRNFLRAGAAASAALAITGVTNVTAQVTNNDLDLVTDGDIAILQFLAAAEILEDDLWQQYDELAENHVAYNQALRRIDRSLVRYINDDRDDERSHHLLINAVLQRIGQRRGRNLVVNLDPFKVIPPPNVSGIAPSPRITNLKNLNVDTSWFNRYRSPQNPDLPPAPGATAQLVNIVGRATVPLSNNQSANEIQLAAHCAAFHFAAIEQGGASLYNGLIDAVISPVARAIVAAIGPTELYHFVGFHKSLENLPAFSASGLSFPNLRDSRQVSEAIFPEPCAFLDASLPLCSVVRPRTNANSGPLAAATGLAQSGLFEGNPNFVAAAVQLAQAAESAIAAQTAQLRAFAASL